MVVVSELFYILMIQQMHLKNNPDLINIKNPLNHWNKYGRYEYRHCSDQYSEKIKETIEIAKKKYEELTR